MTIFVQIYNGVGFVAVRRKLTLGDDIYCAYYALAGGMRDKFSIVWVREGGRGYFNFGASLYKK